MRDDTKQAPPVPQPLPQPLVQQLAPAQQAAANAVNQSVRLGQTNEPLAGQSQPLG